MTKYATKRQRSGKTKRPKAAQLMLRTRLSDETFAGAPNHTKPAYELMLWMAVQPEHFSSPSTRGSFVLVVETFLGALGRRHMRMGRSTFERVRTWLEERDLIEQASRAERQSLGAKRKAIRVVVCEVRDHPEYWTDGAANQRIASAIADLQWVLQERPNLAHKQAIEGALASLRQIPLGYPGGGSQGAPQPAPGVPLGNESELQPSGKGASLPHAAAETTDPLESTGDWAGGLEGAEIADEVWIPDPQRLADHEG